MRTFLLGRPAAIAQRCCMRTKGIEPSAKGIDQSRFEMARTFSELEHCIID